MGDDADATGNLEVTHHHVGVLSRSRCNIKGADHVDGASGDRGLRMLSGRTDDHDRCRAVGHYSLDRLEPTRPEIEVEQNRGRASGDDQLFGRHGFLGTPHHY
jgi:hypothetical protein